MYMYYKCHNVNGDINIHKNKHCLSKQLIYLN